MKSTRILLQSMLACCLIHNAPLFAAEAEKEEPTMESLQAEVARLTSIMPGQAQAMTQIAYNFSNLWFAAQAGNWPLAKFYIDETRVRIRWAMRITPNRRISTGQLDLLPIAASIEENQIKAVADAVAAQDQTTFRNAYTGLMQACQGCHEASEKPFLRLQIPTAPAEPMIRFAP
jgi:cytochrome c553